MSDAPERDPRFASSLDDLSAALGTTERQWRTYSKRPDFPRKVAGKGYEIEACRRWKEENIKPQSSGDLAAARREKVKLEAELLQLRIEREKRLSVLRAEVDELHGKLAMKLRAFLYSKLENEMPPKIAGCDALAIRKYGRALADEIVTTLAKDIAQWETT